LQNWVFTEGFELLDQRGILLGGRVSGPVTRADFKSVGGRQASSVGSTPASSATNASYYSNIK
jgi:hypothetical protein